MENNTSFEKKVEKLREFVYNRMKNGYDANVGLYAVKSKASANKGYHSQLDCDIRHPLRESAQLALWIFSYGDKDFYTEAERILENIIRYQDTDVNSETFGLWSYYSEEKLSDMFNADFNWADFIGKFLVEILYVHSDKLNDDLKHRLIKTLDNAVCCSIKRNSAPDYTNIAVMSSMYIYAAGEMCENNKYKECGKQRIKLLYDYMKYNGAPSEYNSCNYTPVAIVDTSSMYNIIQDEDIKSMILEINEILCRCYAKHYNYVIGQLSAPQCRGYYDYEDNDKNAGVRGFVYMLTKGRYGCMDTESCISGEVCGVAMNGVICGVPYEEFEFSSERWFVERYYRKNNFRSKEDTNIIITDANSDDLYAASYLTPEYCIGSFDGMDTWNQRRNCMITWNEKYLRVRCIKDDYDFCSGFIAASQYKNVIAANIGFTTDRGDFHYILDKQRGKYSAKCLKFVFELGGKTENVSVTAENNEVLYYDKEDNVTIRLRVLEFMFDGKQQKLAKNETTGNFELVCFDTQRDISMEELKSSCGAFVIEVNSEESKAKSSIDNDCLKTEVHTKGGVISVNIPVKPLPFNAMMHKKEVVYCEKG